MGDLSPRLSDVRISLDLISNMGRAGHLSNDAYRALVSLVSACAGKLCWTYEAPTDGSLPDDDEMLRRYAFTTKRRWLKLRPEIEEFFLIQNGRWHLTHEWISLNTATRLAVPSAIYQAVAAREGVRCTYCGDQEGPFDLDHIFPVSRGGTNDPSNLTMACASCNRSKGAKTLAEWVGR